MLTLDQFNDLEVGDLIEAVPIFAGISSEPVSFVVTKRDAEGKRVELNPLYFGVSLGLWTCENKAGKLQWGVSP